MTTPLLLLLLFKKNPRLHHDQNGTRVLSYCCIVGTVVLVGREANQNFTNFQKIDFWFWHSGQNAVAWCRKFFTSTIYSIVSFEGEVVHYFTSE
jgi:hypothetical protein